MTKNEEIVAKKGMNNSKVTNDEDAVESPEQRQVDNKIQLQKEKIKDNQAEKSDLMEALEKICLQPINENFAAEIWLEDPVIFNLDALAKGYGISKAEISNIVKDDMRSIFRFAEKKTLESVNYEYLKMEMATKLNEKYDIKSDVIINFKKCILPYEVRCLNSKSTKKMNFSASGKKKGEIAADRLKNKLKSLVGYFLFDVANFPKCEIYWVPQWTVIAWLLLEDDLIKKLAEGGTPSMDKVGKLLKKTDNYGIIYKDGKIIFDDPELEDIKPNSEKV